MNFYKLGLLHSDIWFSHDKKKYSEIMDNAKCFLQLMGYKKTNCEKAAYYIKKAYFDYDKAVQYSNDISARNNYFKKMYIDHLEVMKYLNKPKLLAFFYKWWWIEFYHKNYLFSLFFLFLYHLITFPIWKWVLVPLPFYYLILSGTKGHNVRNKKQTAVYLTKYWSSIFFIKLNKNHILY